MAVLVPHPFDRLLARMFRELREREAIFDLPVGYDLAGIQSERVRAFVAGMMDATGEERAPFVDLNLLVEHAGDPVEFEERFERLSHRHDCSVRHMPRSRTGGLPDSLRTFTAPGAFDLPPSVILDTILFPVTRSIWIAIKSSRPSARARSPPRGALPVPGLDILVEEVLHAPDASRLWEVEIEDDRPAPRVG